MGKFATGIYRPKNSRKYVGNNGLPKYRSSWELKMFVWMDEHPSVVAWSSECIAIPYMNPETGRPSKYYPDILMQYVDKHNKKHTELIEIKPLRESLQEHAKTKRDKKALLINQAKWEAANIFCKQNGIVFKIITEKDLFFRK